MLYLYAYLMSAVCVAFIALYTMYIPALEYARALEVDNQFTRIPTVIGHTTAFLVFVLTAPLIVYTSFSMARWVTASDHMFEVMSTPE